MTTRWDAHSPLVDGNAQRAQLVGQAVFMVAAWLTQSWAFVGLLAVVMAVGAVWWPRRALFVQLYGRFVAPQVSADPVDGRPMRFAAAFAALTLPPLAIGIAAGASMLEWIIVVGNITVMTSEAVSGRCGLCDVFVWATRRGMVRLRHPLVEP